MIRWRFVFGFLGLLAVSFQANAQSALTHASGNVEVAVTDFGSLGAVRERAIAPNFEFPKSGGAYYLHERSEIWVGDADGNVIAPSPAAIDALLNIWPIFEAFQLVYVSKGLLLDQEKNVSALSPNGPSAGASATAKPARKPARTARRG